MTTKLNQNWFYSYYAIANGCFVYGAVVDRWTFMVAIQLTSKYALSGSRESQAKKVKHTILVLFKQLSMTSIEMTSPFGGYSPDSKFKGYDIFLGM